MKRLILLTTEFPPFLGGIGAVAHELAQASAALGVEVVVRAPDYHNRMETGDAKLPYKVERFRSGGYSGRNMPIYLKEALRVRNDPDDAQIVAADGPFMEALALTKTIHRRPFDVILHGSEILRASRSRARRLIGLRRLYDAPRRIIANSIYTRDLLLETMPFIAPEKVHIGYLAAHKRWFKAPDSRRVDALLGERTRHLVVATGRITPRKGQVKLLEAVCSDAFSPSIRDNLTLVIAGRVHPSDQDYADRLRAEMGAAAPARVILRGDLDDDDLRALYSEADLFCIPGTTQTQTSVEGFGLVFIEAAAQGLPSLAGSVGAVPETVVDGQTGRLVTPDDTNALAVALSQMLSDPETLSKMRTAALSHAKSFSWKAFAETALELS